MWNAGPHRAHAVVSASRVGSWTCSRTKSRWVHSKRRSSVPVVRGRVPSMIRLPGPAPDSSKPDSPQGSADVH